MSQKDKQLMNLNITSIDDYRRLHRQSIESPDQFWPQLAKEFYWHKLEDNENVLSYNMDSSSAPIGVHFMSGSQTNVCYNLIDRNIDSGFGHRIAYQWVGHEFELKKTLTYSELKSRICEFANVLKGFGLKKGDTVVHYMPGVIQTVVSMLSCARLGLIYANTFPGYSAQCLAERMIDLKCKLLITSDVFFFGKQFLDLKPYSDKAIDICIQNGHEIKARIFVKYLDQNYCQYKWEHILDPRLDHWWHELIATAEPDCPPVWLDSEEPLFVVFSSGSTGKQKAIVHSSGGFMLYSAVVFRHAFNYTDGDVLFCPGCLGWITGQFANVFGSLANAATVVLSEGSQTHPSPGRWWRLIDEYNVNIFYVNPTDVRILRSFGDQYVNEYRMSHLKVIGVVGEVTDDSTWRWLFDVVGRKRCPVVDTYFQSETGCPIIFAIPGAIPIKQGSVSLPFFGVEPVIVDENGVELESGMTGTLVIKTAWPSITRGLYNDYKLYEKSYFEKYPKYYFTGDGMHWYRHSLPVVDIHFLTIAAIRDSDGYVWIKGRVDDMINNYSLLISASEVESVVMSCERVSEVAAVPIPHQIYGQIIEKIGSVGCGGLVVHGVRALPKNRSAKIMRRILAKIVSKDDNLGDISTVSEPSVIDEIKCIFSDK